MKNCDNCGHCINHRKQNDEWICTNPDSECYGCWTEYNHYCDFFEAREVKSTFSVEIKNFKK